MSKIIEKLVCKQLTDYFKMYNLFDTFQSGFRAQHSTGTALLKVTDDIFRSIDNSNVTLLLLLDYSKAFDTINHHILLAKMKALGVANSALNWFNSYLSNRYQRVVTPKDKSDWKHVINGVPQGSILGPFLFTIMISDFSSCITNCNYHMYADDTQLYCPSSVDDLTETISLINSDLENVAGYSYKNGLRLNPSKTVFMIIGSHQNISKINSMSLPPVLLKNTQVVRQGGAKNLGITFDEVLSWRRHICILI